MIKKIFLMLLSIIALSCNTGLLEIEDRHIYVEGSVVRSVQVSDSSIPFLKLSNDTVIKYAFTVKFNSLVTILCDDPSALRVYKTNPRQTYYNDSNRRDIFTFKAN